MLSVNVLEVNGPVETITGWFLNSSRLLTSSFIILIFGIELIVLLTSFEKLSLSTAKADPAGTLLWSAHFIIKESAIRNSSCKTPTALYSLSSERKELEQTSSAKYFVWWASVFTFGLISYKSTFISNLEIWYAASHPAKPPPIITILLILVILCFFI